MGAPAAQINGRVVVAGGMSWPNYYNDVIYTDNGTDWSQKTAAFTTSRDAMALVNYNGMLWMLGGLVNGNPTNEVWYSAEGLTWTKEAVSAGFPSIYFPSAVAFDEKMWVLGGYTSSVTNDVWYSTNGGVWTKEAQAAPFTGKQQMGCIVYPEEGGKIWLIGGAYYSGGTVYTNEVWSSSDGSHWTKSAQNPVLDAVESPVCFNFDGKMWAISGIGAYGYYSKVLSSTDGTAWNTVSSYFSGSFASIGWASGGKMWLVGDVPNPGSERSLWYSNP